MGSAITKTEIYKQMEADLKEIQLGAANLQKIQTSITGIQDKATGSIQSFGDVQTKVTGKIDESTKKITDMGQIQNTIQGKLGKFEGAIKKAASGALTGQLTNMTGGVGDLGKKALGGFGF